MRYAYQFFVLSLSLIWAGVGFAESSVNKNQVQQGQVAEKVYLSPVDFQVENPLYRDGSVIYNGHEFAVCDRGKIFKNINIPEGKRLGSIDFMYNLQNAFCEMTVSVVTENLLREHQLEDGKTIVEGNADILKNNLRLNIPENYQTMEDMPEGTAFTVNVTLRVMGGPNNYYVENGDNTDPSMACSFHGATLNYFEE